MTDPAKKHAIWLRAGSKCEHCGVTVSRRKGTGHVHHKTYEREGNEDLRDLELLCLQCHNERHPDHDFVSKAEQKRRAARNAARRERKRKKLERDPEWDEKWGYAIREARNALEKKKREIEGK